MLLDGIVIAEGLRSLRAKKNKTIDEVANEINIHPNTLSKHEKDATNLKLGLLKRILEYYGINEIIFFNIISEYTHNK